ncbi:MAG: hypothetical protein ACLQDV_02330 [Candidatus Binataceae bacterium]
MKFFFVAALLGAGLRPQSKDVVSAIEFKGSHTDGIPRERTSE